MVHGSGARQSSGAEPQSTQSGLGRFWLPLARSGRRQPAAAWRGTSGTELPAHLIIGDDLDSIVLPDAHAAAGGGKRRGR